MRVLVLICALLLAPAAALAAQVPSPGVADPRVQSIEYDPNQVVILQGTLGNQLMLEFGPGERLENVAIGDSMAWQVTPNKRADLLFIKPLNAKAATNMTVVTSERRYLFELRVAPRSRAMFTPYLVRFTYPAPAVAVVVEPEPEKPPEVVNSAYVMTGSLANRPQRIFDDGHSVYLQWTGDATIPAIFAVSPENGESLVNYVARGDYIVIQQLSPRFVLRNGKQVTTIVNQAYSAAKVAGNAR